jgi:hypothetical protein
MKNLLILMIVLSLGCSQVTKVVVSPKIHPDGYIAFREFKGDTLNYLNKNFSDNKQNYIGKELNSLLNDLETEVKCCTPMSNANNKHSSSGMIILFNTLSTQIYQDVNNIRSYSVQVFWKDPMQMDSVLQFEKATHFSGWSDAHNVFFGKQIIGDIKIVSSTPSLGTKD